MTSTAVDVPGMYADHHVVEVRRVLLDQPGVTAVYASSAFGVVEIEFDPERTTAEDLERRLDELGYRSDLPVPRESGDASPDGRAAGLRYRRSTTTHAAAGTGVTFRQAMDGESEAAPESTEEPTGSTQDEGEESPR